MTFSYTFGIGWVPSRARATVTTGNRIIDQIIRDTAQRHGLFAGELTGPARNRQASRARHEAMWLAYEARRPDGSRLYTLPFIGRRFGRDHTSVLYGVRKHGATVAAEKVAA